MATEAIERALEEGDGWQIHRARRLRGEDVEPVAPTGQDELGAFVGPTGEPSPGATGLALCHLKLLGLGSSGPAVIAADWLLEVRTPAQAWLDAPAQVPGELDTPAAGRVWATASAACALLATGRDPGPRALDLLRGEADQEGRFTGGAYPTFAAAGAYWLATGPKTEMAEWALRWARENADESWDAETFVSGLIFWLAAGISPDHATIEVFMDELRGRDEQDHLEISLRTAELRAHLGT